MMSVIPALLGLALLLNVVSCQRAEDPLKLGFVGPLSGHWADLGVAGRNGALLAIEKINASGGIKGRMLELVVRDDRNDPVTVKAVDNELIKSGVAAIIGHMTSSAAETALPIINKARIVMLSPTVSSTDFNGIDDYFLRINPANQGVARKLSELIATGTPIRRVAAICDLSNRSNTESYLTGFRTDFENRGGKVVSVTTFNHPGEPHFFELAAKLLQQKPEGILILASALDTALLAQQIRKQDKMVPLFTTGWSASEDLISNGGSAVEGIRFFQTFNQNDTGTAYTVFKESYRKRFGVMPSFAALNAYECILVIAEAVAVNDDLSRLKETIIAKGGFKGVQATFVIDRYGDTVRKPFLMTIKDGRFVQIVPDRNPGS